jgi:cytochrome c
MGDKLMMHHVATAAAGAALMLAASTTFAAVDAAQAEALAKKYNCLQCHSADKKILGPAYKDVAKKYKGTKDAQARLVMNVKAGTTGTWGPIPMPPNDKVSDAEAATLVEWILSM